MQILRDTDPCPRPPQGTVVTIGAYDGVHLGHRAVIAEVRRRAALAGARSAVVTFDRHPAQVIRPDSAPLLLTAFGLRETTYKVTGAPIAALPLQILDGSRSQFPVAQGKAWAGALELILVVLLLTASARVVGRKATKAGRTY